MSDPYNHIGRLVEKDLEYRFTALAQLRLWMHCHGYVPPPYEPILLDRSNWTPRQPMRDVA